MLEYAVVAGEIAITILMGIGGMSNFVGWLKGLFNRPNPMVGMILHSKDFKEEYSDCTVCGKAIKRTHYLFGDGVWRHE
jgi:Flp pilus assembly pilin Flp